MTRIKYLPLFLSLLFLLACVPTPETEYVVNKGDQKEMIDMARVEVSLDAPETQTGESPKMDYQAAFGVPEQLVLDTEEADGKVRLIIDADIIVPDAPLPIVRVFAGEFEQEAVYRLWAALVDRTLYLDDPELDVQTKADIAAYMQRLTELMDDPEEWMARYNSIEEIEDEIRDLQKRYREAPDAKPDKQPTVADGTLKTETVTMDGTEKTARRVGLTAGSRSLDPRDSMSFTVRNDTDNAEAIVVDYGGGEWGVIPIDKGASLWWSRWAPAFACGGVLGCHKIELSHTDPLPEEAKDFLQTTPAGAVEKAEAFLKKAGLSDSFAVTQLCLCDDRSPQNHRPEPENYAYYVYCSRKVNGAPCCTTRGAWRSGEDLFARTYVPSWDYESLLLRIDDTGLYEVRWEGKLTVSDTLVKAANLMPFDGIETAIRTRLPLVLPHRVYNNGKITARVDRIELGLWRVLEQHELGRGLLIPAYALYGTAEMQYEDGSVVHSDEYGLLYLVNAVDGSVIDADKGY